MARISVAQLNIRSQFARERATELARRTGMTATQVVEEALRAYSPPETADADEALPPGLARKGLLLVFTGGGPITLEETNAAIEDGRNRPLFYDDADPE